MDEQDGRGYGSQWLGRSGLFFVVLFYISVHQRRNFLNELPHCCGDFFAEIIIQGIDPYGSYKAMRLI